MNVILMQQLKMRWKRQLQKLKWWEDENTRFQQFLVWHRQIKDKDAHIALRNTLIDHFWEEYTYSEG